MARLLSRCQVRGVMDSITCPETDSGGVHCEKIGPHEDHWISDHTIKHYLAGNGYPCDVI